MTLALGEPGSVAAGCAAAAVNHEKLFWDDYLEVLETGKPAARWKSVELAGPMFYRSYGELVQQSGRPLVILMPHMGCFVSGLFCLHRYSPTDRPLCAFRQSNGPRRTARLFDRLSERGPRVALLDESRGAAIRAYSCLRRGGVLFSFIDGPIGSDSDACSDPVEFFAVPAALPDGPIRLAIATRALLGFLFVSSSGSQRLRVTISEPIDPTVASDQRGALDFARCWMAAQLESAIVSAPTEWLNWPSLGEIWKQGMWRAQNSTS